MIKEEVNLSLFPDGMILYVKNPKECTKKLLELINECSKVGGYKIHAEKSVVLCISATNSLKRKLRKQFHLQ